MQTVFEVPQGRFQLRRLPYRKNEQLLAWDAADEYLLNFLACEGIPANEAQVTIVNDSFGALTLALSVYQPVAISDSYLSRQATMDNLRLNDVDANCVALLDSLNVPDRPIDYLLIKIPKTLALLEYQLHRLRPLLNQGSKIIAAGMVKALPANAWKLLERLIGPTKPSLAVKKARLIFAEFDSRLVLPPNPYPVRYALENTDLIITNHANVFSRDSLDIGTRLLLQHLPASADYRRVIDLGCGNGVVGLMLAKELPYAEICFVDESFMAIASARENFERANAGQRKAEFVVGDCLNDFAAQSADCIVCNPPFHQQYAVGDHIAWRMFQQSHKVLIKSGELRVIGNRHLNYHQSLKKIFGNCELVASNAKFVVLKAVKT